MEKNFEVEFEKNYAGVTVALAEDRVDVYSGVMGDYDNTGHAAFTRAQFQDFVAEVNNAWYEITASEAFESFKEAVK